VTCPTSFAGGIVSIRAATNAASWGRGGGVGGAKENQAGWARKNITEREVEVARDQDSVLCCGEGPDGEVVYAAQGALHDVGGVEAALTESEGDLGGEALIDQKGRSHRAGAAPSERSSSRSSTA
jgi:hypothetical protein